MFQNSQILGHQDEIGRTMGLCTMAHSDFVFCVLMGFTTKGEPSEWEIAVTALNTKIWECVTLCRILLLTIIIQRSEIPKAVNTKTMVFWDVTPFTTLCHVTSLMMEVQWLTLLPISCPNYKHSKWLCLVQLNKKKACILVVKNILEEPE